MSEDTPVIQLSLADKVRANKDVIIKRSLLVGGAVAGIAITAGLLSRRNDDFYDEEDLEPVGEEVDINVDGSVSE